MASRSLGERWVSMAKSKLAYGEEVVIPWGVDEVHGTVREVYGSGERTYVVVDLTPELSDSVVSEPTTVTMPLSAVKKAVPAT